MGHITWTDEEIAQHEATKRPRFSAMAHVSLRVRDVEEAKRFYTDVLGGRLILDEGEFAEAVVAGTIVGFSSKSGRVQEADAEYPHVAFYIEADQFLSMKRWLEEHGVKTHEPWTRNGRSALMFFKDPSGNLFEIYCKEYPGADQLKRAGIRGGGVIVDLAELDYEWGGG